MLVQVVLYVILCRRKWVPAMDNEIIKLQQSIEQEIHSHFGNFEEIVIQVRSVLLVIFFNLFPQSPLPDGSSNFKKTTLLYGTS